MTLFGGVSYPCAEMQSVYLTNPAETICYRTQSELFSIELD